MATERGKEGFMSTALKLLLLPALVVAFSVGVALAATGGSDDGGPAPLPASSSTTTESGTTSTERGTTTVEDGQDISGPCDEAEHANDPRCTGGAPAGSSEPGPGRDEDRGDGFREPREDVSGPCDEAGHANDPRCTGGAPAGRSGPGAGRDDDRSGRSGPDNSGPGSESSGPGSDVGGDHGGDD
jgi:hypothetical protein